MSANLAASSVTTCPWQCRAAGWCRCAHRPEGRPPLLCQELRPPRDYGVAIAMIRRANLAPSDSIGAIAGLGITPAPGRASPVREGIIKRPAAGTPNPVGRDPRPRIKAPSAGLTIRPPMRRSRSAVPLARVTGCLVRAAAPATGWCRMPVWAIAIPYLRGDGCRTRGGWPHLPPRRSRLRCQGGSKSKHSRQCQSENAHPGSPAGLHVQPITDRR